jgi:hypothetical protein
MRDREETGGGEEGEGKAEEAGGEQGKGQVLA